MDKKIFWIIFGVFILLFNISFLYAFSIPSDWWGTARIDGEYADGEEVSAYINNVKVASATVGAIQPNYYLIHVPGKLGDLIQFKINGRNTENEFQEWILGSHKLNLITNISIKKLEGKKSHSSKNHFVQFCDVNWQCSGWSECKNGFMTRQCYDKNHCEDSYNKPIEKTGCELISQVLIKEDEPKYSFILIGIITTLILFIILISLLGRK